MLIRDSIKKMTTNSMRWIAMIPYNYAARKICLRKYRILSNIADSVIAIVALITLWTTQMTCFT